MPIACHAYYTARDRLRAFLLRAFLKVSRPQLTNLSLLTFGLFAAGNSQLPRLAVRLPLPVGAASLTQRLRRLLRNEALAPGTLYAPVPPSASRTAPTWTSASRPSTTPSG